MILLQRCWFCGDLATERDDDGNYLCNTHYHLVREAV